MTFASHAQPLPDAAITADDINAATLAGVATEPLAESIEAGGTRPERPQGHLRA